MSAELVIVGDQAFLPEEWERLQKKRAWDRAYRQRPEVRAREAERNRAWVERNWDRVRAYRREWMQRRRQDPEYREAERLRDRKRHLQKRAA